jgi:dTDP-4-dehydrorhamnose reductase
VFDGKKNSSYIEVDKAVPINEYGASKLRGENHILKNYDKFFIFRVSGIFSEHGDNFVKTMMRLKDRNELSVVSDQLMKPSSASFIANFLSINLLKNNFTMSNVGLYHLTCSGLGISWFDFAKLIFQEMTEQKLITQGPKISPILSKNYESSVIRPKFSVLSNDKVKEKFILPHGNYRQNLEDELNRIYQSL